MLGTIEDLEKDIEQFRNNVVASNEMYAFLSQMLEQLKQQNITFDRKSEELISRLDSIPVALDEANATSNATVKKDVSIEVERAIRGFSDEQSKYLKTIEQMQQQIHSYIEQSQKRVQIFSDKSDELIGKVAAVPEQIKADTKASLENHRSLLDSDLEKRSIQMADAQQKYISAMEKTSVDLKNCENQLLSKYQEFIQTLERSNISNLYEQNQKLHTVLNMRTTILMAISAISVVLGIVGLII